MSLDVVQNADEPTEKLPDHHKKLEYCLTRKLYRKGKRSTATKVFTVNSESKYLMVRNVHAIGLHKELVKVFSKYGNVVQCEELKDYPKEAFTQVFLVKFEDINSARITKRRTDELQFFGSMLHVFYAPEYETPEEARAKLNERRATVVSRIRILRKEANKLKIKDSGLKEEPSKSQSDSAHQSLQKSTHSNFVQGAFAKLQSSVVQGSISPTLHLHLPVGARNKSSNIARTTSYLPVGARNKSSDIAQTTNYSRTSLDAPESHNEQKKRTPTQNSTPKFIKTSKYVPPRRALPSISYPQNNNTATESCHLPSLANVKTMKDAVDTTEDICRRFNSKSMKRPAISTIDHPLSSKTLKS